MMRSVGGAGGRRLMTQHGDKTWTRLTPPAQVRDRRVADFDFYRRTVDRGRVGREATPRRLVLCVIVSDRIVQRTDTLEAAAVALLCCCLAWMYGEDGVLWPHRTSSCC